MSPYLATEFADAQAPVVGSNYVAKVSSLSRISRSVAWLVLLIYLLVAPTPLDANLVLWCSGYITVVTIHGLARDARGGFRQLMCLHNAVWLGLLMYALPIYVISAITDISLLLDMKTVSLRYAAKLTFISIAVAGITLELIRPWAISLHRLAMVRIGAKAGARQYLVAIALVAVYGANYVSSGVLNIVTSGDRFAITQAFESGKMWFIQYLMTGVTIAFIYQHLKQPRARHAGFYIGLMSIISFWVMYLSLGNRRGILTVILAGAVCFVARSENWRRVAATLLLVIIAAGSIGVLRQENATAPTDQALMLALGNSLGEVIYPSYTLVKSVELGNPSSVGFTWLSMPFEFVSARLLGQPFAFLGQRFAIAAAPTDGDLMGFAYMPITESYQNLGALGATFSGATLLTSVLGLAWICRRKPWVYVLLFSLILDMNRSEFSAMLFELVMISGGFLLTKKVKI